MTGQVATALGRFLGLLAFLAMTMLAACSDATGPGAPAASAVQNAAPAGPIAFEPVTGMPDSRAAELAAALAQRATSRSLVVVARDDGKLRYRVKGYFAAHPGTGQTTVSYIWDVFDKDGTRVHRFEGYETVPASGASDAWGSVTPETLDRIADATASELTRFLSTVNAHAEAAPPKTSGTLAYMGARGKTAALPARPRFFVASADSNISDGAAALPEALRGALTANGADVASDAADADIVVSAETAITPGEKGRQMVAIVWSARRADGSNLGSVRQVSRVLEGTLDHGWGDTAVQAASAAGPALVQLVSGS